MSTEQIVIGEVEPFNNDEPFLVVCDSWPSLAFALTLKGYTNVTAKVSTEVKHLLTILKGVNDNDDIINFKIVDDSDSRLGYGGDLINTTLFIQGSEAFVKSNSLKHSGTVKRLVSLSNVVHRRKCGFMATHSNMGGVTTGKYRVNLINCEKLKEGWNKAGLTRRLKNILKSTVKGITVGNVQNYTNRQKRKRNQSEVKILNPDMKINTNDIQVEVVAPCVLNKSGWVRRLLTSEELLEAFDINTAILPRIVSCVNLVELLKLITQSAPGKVCEGLVTAFTTAHYCSTNTTTVGSVVEENKDKGIQWMVDENEALINDDNAKRGDDWETDVSQWNKYIVTEFKSNLEWDDFQACNQKYCVDNKIDIDSFKNKTADPLICKGKVTSSHLKLFAGLRRLMLRKYRRNLIKSFTTYAARRYGKNWSDELKGREKLFELLNKPKDGSINNKKRKRGHYCKGERTVMPTSMLKDLHIDVEVASEAISRVCATNDGGSGDETNWWDWSGGSTLFFWRWHPFMSREARSGTSVWRTGAFAPYRKRQTWPKNPDHKAKMLSKLVKVVRRGYIQPGQICSLTGFFAVPKGESDIRMVYDATKCGLNDTIWAPTFLLPTIDTTLRQVDIGGFMSDIDLGEMFLNFPLDEKLKKYAGVDLTELRQELIDGGLDVDSEFGKNRIFLRWTRCLMGLRSSPYTAVRYFAWIEEFIKGSRSDKGNIFRFDQVRLNLPGMQDYDPSLPPVGKVLNVGQGLVPNFSVYIDDIRICGGTLRDVVKAARRIASRCNYMGIQDAPRKRRFPSRAPGVWSGAKSISTLSGLYTCTTQAKWERGKVILLEWQRQYDDNDGLLDRKDMERGRGFLVHLARTYPIMVSNLKGIHHAIESWRSGRDKNGWKISTDEWKLFLEEISEKENDEMDHFNWHEEKKAYLAKHDKDAPVSVDASKVKRFSTDLNELLNLMRADKPPRRLVRGKSVVMVKYGFGDASGCGFGASWESDRGISFRMGIWSEEDNKDKSSNYRELKNLVETLELMGEKGELKGVEIFFFTDNSTAERAFYKGSLSSRLLHALVSRLRALEMYVGCKIYLCHVSGKRMIAQGTDGLSRGNTAEGVMKKGNMLEFIPLHISALERNTSLLNWLRELCEGHNGEGKKLEVLSPLDWFGRGHDHLGDVQNVDGIWMPKLESGILLWHPAPAAAETALEELRLARLKRTKSTHVFVCPRLLEPHWRSHLHKSADLVLEVPAGTRFWPEEMFEPLIIAFYFPYLSHRPWELRNSPSLVELGRRLRSLWKTDEESAGTLLRKFWSSKLLDFHIHDATTDAGLVWKRKKDENRFLHARDGDMWMIGFQCEYCWIVNLKKREVRTDDPKDRILCAYIRRFNLDAMWSREPKTVSGNLGQLKKGALLSRNMGLDPVNIDLGPWPVGDPYGVQIGLEMLASSQLEGRHNKAYQQFDTIRKIRSGFSTAFESSPNGWNMGNMVFKAERGKTYTIHSMPTESHLFTHFSTGVLKRMGRVVIPEMGLSNAIVHAILDHCESIVSSTESLWKDVRQAIMNGAFYCTLYGNSLRGHEGLYLEASDLCSHIEFGKDGLWEYDGLVPDTGHVCYPLLGRFKTEYGEQKYMPQTVNVTKSGIELRLWMERLVYVLIKEGKQFDAGPAFCYEDGYLISSRDMNFELLQILEIVKFSNPKLFEGSKEIEREYGVSRSFRRGSNSRAKEEGVDKELRDFINRWSSFEAKKGSTPSMSMAQHYVEAKLIMKRTLVYSRSL